MIEDHILALRKKMAYPWEENETINLVGRLFEYLRSIKLNVLKNWIVSAVRRGASSKTGQSF